VSSLQPEATAVAFSHATNATCNMFSIRAVHLWNNLPSHIVNAASIGTFKKTLYNYLLSVQAN
jgi:hypothetical protein